MARNGHPLPGEQAHERILNEEGQDAADKFIDSQEAIQDGLDAANGESD